MKYFRVLTVLVLLVLAACGDTTTSPAATSTLPVSSIAVPLTSLSVSPATTTAPVSPSSPAAITQSSQDTPDVPSQTVPTAHVIMDGTTAPPPTAASQPSNSAATVALKNVEKSTQSCYSKGSDDPGVGNLAFRCATQPQPGHMARIEAVAYSPDGKFFASAAHYPDNTVKLWEAASGKLIQTFYLDIFNSVSQLGFTPDSKSLYAVTDIYPLLVWEVETRQLVRKMDPLPDNDDRVIVSPDLKTLATFSLNSGPATSFTLWDEATAKKLGTIEAATSKGSLRTLAFSPDSKTVAAGGSFGKISFWDIASLKQTGELAGINNVGLLDYSPDGKILFVGAFSGVPSQFWDINAHKKLSEVIGGSSPGAFAFSADSHSFADLYQETIKVWDVNSGKEKASLPAERSAVGAFAFSPDGKFLLFGTYENDNKLVKWDLGSNTAQFTIAGVKNPLYSVAVSPDNKQWAVGDVNSTVTFWDATPSFPIPQTFVKFPPFTDSNYSDLVYSAYSPDGKYFATTNGNWGLSLWELSSNKKLNGYGNFGHKLLSFQFSPDSKRLAIYDSEGGLELAAVTASGLLPEAVLLKGTSNSNDKALPVYQVAFSPDSKYLGAVSVDKTVKIWDVEDRKLPLVRTFEKHTAPVRSLAFSNDGKLVASGDEAGNIKVWDFSSGQEKFTVQQPGEPVNFLGFNKNENYIIATTETGNLKMWDITVNPPKSYTNSLFTELVGGGIRQTVLSPDRRTLVTIHGDGTLRKWEVIG